MPIPITRTASARGSSVEPRSRLYLPIQSAWQAKGSNLAHRLSRQSEARGRSPFALAERQQGERGEMVVVGLSRIDRPVAGASLGREGSALVLPDHRLDWRNGCTAT